MNKRGGITLLAIVFALLYFMVGMMAYQFLKVDITAQRDSDHLNCSSPSTDGDRVSCLFLDGVIPIIVITILSVTGGIITDLKT